MSEIRITIAADMPSLTTDIGLPSNSGTQQSSGNHNTNAIVYGCLSVIRVTRGQGFTHSFPIFSINPAGT